MSRRHALRVGLCVFKQIFEVLVVDRFLELLEGSAARADLSGGSLVHLVPHPCVEEENGPERVVQRGRLAMDINNDKKPSRK